MNSIKANGSTKKVIPERSRKNVQEKTCNEDKGEIATVQEAGRRPFTRKHYTYTAV